MYRARAIALGGPESFFEEMPPEVRYAEGLLEIERRWDFETQLEGRGLVLLPLAFATPRVFVTLDGPYVLGNGEDFLHALMTARPRLVSEIEP